MAVSTVKLNGQTLMTVNDTTATASDVINKYFYAADGTKTLGTASGGSTPTLITKSITANGTYDAEDDSADGYSSVTVNVSGGGGEEAEENDVMFIDYDGKILYSYSASEFQALSALPANPSHDGLTAQGWNWSLTDAKAQVTATGEAIIGQMYTPTDGKTKLYVRFDDANRLSPYLALCPNGTVTIDWGDGSSTSTMTGSSLTTIQRVQHTYSAVGDYVIKLTPATGTTFAFQYSQNVPGPLRHGTGTAATDGYRNYVYNGALRKVEIGNGAQVNGYAFNKCYNLETITFPNSTFTFGSYVFRECYGLKSVVVPTGSSVTGTYAFAYCTSMRWASFPKSMSVANYLFYYAYGLRRAVIPYDISSIGTYSFDYCYALRRASLPTGITSMGASLFQYAYNLASVTIPAGVTSIGTSAFAGCYGMKAYHFKPTTPPTLSNTNALSNIQDDCKIYVPKSANQTVLNTYKSTSNWSTYASYMEEEP